MRIRQCIGAITFAILLRAPARCQEPAEAPLADQPPATGAQVEPEAAPTPELPELPETTIIGRPDPFPSQPLQADTLLTPSGTETFAGQTGSSVTVITRDEIVATRKSTVLEVLRQSVGLDVVQSGGPGGVASVFIRGANSDQTKVLLDGIPLNDPGSANRAFDFSTLTVDNIERIEIARGPQSLIYGSDAVGGVINIITRRGEGPLRVGANLMGGSFGTHREAINFSGGTDTYYYSFAGSYLDTDGISSVSRRFGGFEDDGYQNATFSGRFGWTHSEALNVDYVFRYIDADTEVDDFLLDNPFRENRRQQFFNRVQLQSLLFDGALEQKVGFSLTDYNLIDTFPGLFGVPEFDGQGRTIDYQANWAVSDTNVLSAGMNYLAEDGSSTVLPQQSQNLSGVYVQDQFSIRDRAFTTIGVRWDEHSTAGAAQTYRFTQLIRVDETGTAFHGSLGRGFRAPAIAQQFGIVGNPALRPEFSKGWDVGATQELFCGDLSFDATYFRNDFVDLIVFDPTIPGPGGFGALNNVGRARTSGLELTGTYAVTPCTTLTASYTFLDTLDLTTGLELLRRPRNKATFSVHHRCLCDRASLNLYFLYVGTRADFDELGNIITLDPYYLVNLSADYQLNKRWQLYGRIDNVLDFDYEEVFGFGTPGISFYGGSTFRY